MQKQNGVESLYKRISDLEQQLAEAQATIHALQKGNGKNIPGTLLTHEAGLMPAGEEGFRQALLAVPYPLLIWREDGRILLVNETFTELSGYTLPDIPTYEAWLHKAFDQQILQQPFVMFYEQFPGQDVKKTREFEITTRSGERRVWDFSNAVLGADQENRSLMITMAVDVTERRQIEEQLEENEQRFSIIFNKAPFAAALSTLPEGAFVDINEEFERVFGYNKRELLGKTSLEVGIHPHPQRREEILAQIQAQGNARNVETPLQTKSGETRNFLLNIDLVSISGQKYILQTAQDITDRKQAEETMKEMARLLELDRARLSTILEHLPIGVWISDQEGKLIGKNEQADRIWAGEAPLLNGINEFQQYRAWYPGSVEPLKPEEYPLAIALRTGQPVHPVELDIRRFDGSEGTVLVSAVPIRDHHGTVTGVVAVNMDITDRKRAEQDRRKAEERYTTLFNSVQEGFAHYKAVYNAAGQIIDLIVIEINPSGAKISGVAREDQLGKTWRQVWPQLDDQLFSVYQRVDETGESIRFDDHNKITGRIYDVTISRLVRGDFIVSFNDITDRKQVEKALQESEQRYRGLFERMQEGLIAAEVITDKNGKPIDYRYLDVNPASERQFNIPRERFIGRRYTEVMPESDPEWIEILGKVALTGRPASVERYFQSSRKWFEAHAYSPRPGQFVNILTDITERKQAEESLRKSEERFSKAFHSSPDAIIISQMSDGLIIEVNEGWSKIFGQKPSEVLGKTSLELGAFVNPEDRKKALLLLQEHGSLRDFEVQVRRKSGEIFQGSMSVERIEMGGVDYLLTIMRDITQRKQAEERIAYQARLLASVNDAIVGSDASYRLTAWNAAAEAIYGWKAEEVLGRMGTEILETEWSQKEAEDMRRMIAETGRWRGEATQRRKDGTRIPVEVSSMVLRDEQGQITGYVSVNRDITERKMAERALQESEERFRSLANSMPQLVWTALPDGRVDYYNQRYQEYQDIKQVNREDWEWAPVLHPADTQATVDAWLHSLETGDIYEIEHRVRMNDGSYRWHLSRGVPMHDEKGKIIRWFGTATDIHDLKLAEEKLKVYANRLEKSNRELEQFAFMASHDLQEPLRKIEMFGDLLLERATSLPERERSYLDRMRDAASRMRDMIEGLLQLSRVATQGKPFAQVSLAQVSASVLADLEDRILSKKASIEVGPLPTITGDPLQLRQLMQNLISNALKYHQPGKPPEIHIFANELTDKVQICVEDKGIGFDQEDADRIFEPFQRLVGRSQYEGSGIGLAICRRIVERHGGEIAVMSEPGSGTTFVISFPKPSPKNIHNEPRKKGS